MLCILRKPISECISEFTTLARHAFTSRFVSNRSLCSYIASTIRSWARDGKYDASPLEACLRQAYGDERKMHDYPVAGISNAKVAVTATTISDASLCIFSNYKDNKSRNGRSDLQIKWV
jgi:hypothetical protein